MRGIGILPFLQDSCLTFTGCQFAGSESKVEVLVCLNVAVDEVFKSSSESNNVTDACSNYTPEFQAACCTHYTAARYENRSKTEGRSFIVRKGQILAVTVLEFKLVRHETKRNLAWSFILFYRDLRRTVKIFPLMPVMNSSDLCINKE